jgi:hypothetical protein
MEGGQSWTQIYTSLNLPRMGGSGNPVTTTGIRIPCVRLSFDDGARPGLSI